MNWTCNHLKSRRSICLLPILILVSCTAKLNTSTQEYSIEYFDDETTIHQSKHCGKVLPTNEIDYGQVVSFAPANKQESNLIRQHQAYISYMFIGDLDGMRNFLFPEAIKYYRKTFPDMDDLQIFNQLLGNYCENMAGFREYESRTGSEFDIVIGERKMKIASKENIIYELVTYGNICLGDYDFHTATGETIFAISIDNGVSWTFLSKTEDSQGILSLRFSEEIVEHIIHE